MSLDPELRELMNQTIELHPRAGSNAYQQPAWDSPISLRGRVEGKSRLVRDSYGNLITASAVVYLESAQAKEGDEVSLPDGRRLSVLGIEPMPDEEGEDYYLALTLG